MSEDKHRLSMEPSSDSPSPDPDPENDDNTETELEIEPLSSGTDPEKFDDVGDDRGGNSDEEPLIYSPVPVYYRDENGVVVQLGGPVEPAGGCSTNPEPEPDDGNEIEPELPEIVLPSSSSSESEDSEDDDDDEEYGDPPSFSPEPEDNNDEEDDPDAYGEPPSYSPEPDNDDGGDEAGGRGEASGYSPDPDDDDGDVEINKAVPEEAVEETGLPYESEASASSPDPDNDHDDVNKAVLEELLYQPGEYIVRDKPSMKSLVPEIRGRRCDYCFVEVERHDLLCCTSCHPKILQPNLPK